MPSVFKQVKPRLNASTLRAALTVAFLFPWLFLPAEARADDQDLQKFNQFVQASNSASVKILREGRDLIDAAEWAKAEEKFDQFLRAYAKDKDVDVALYWLAYARKKQGHARAALEPLKTLLKKYRNSSWADEARVMVNEIAGELGDTKVVQGTLGDKDEDEEIKVVALQSLFEANPERAISYIREILKPGSTASPSLKEAAVSLLGSRGGPEVVPVLIELARTHPDPEIRQRAIHGLADGGESVIEDLARLYTTEREQEVKRQILHSLAEMSESPRARQKLIEVARSQSESEELRRSAIHWLAQARGGSVFDDLWQIYTGEPNLGIKRQILHAFAEMNDARATARLLEAARNPAEHQEIRRSAVHWIGERGDESAVDELMKIYDSDRDAEIRRQILHAFSQMESPRARQRLADAARRGDDSELRRSAIHWLGETDDPQAMEMLVAMYDGEQDRDIKAQLLHAFGQSKQKRALQKLMDVARRDPSVEMRKAAVHWLGESDDPEALKFLEDLLKP